MRSPPQALLTLMGLFVMAQGLLRSGALDRLRELLALVVAILLPVTQGWCQRRGTSPSRWLMPLSLLVPSRCRSWCSGGVRLLSAQP